MFEFTLGVGFSALVLLIAARLVLTMPAKRRPTVEAPWQKLEDRLATERAALLEAGRRIGAERGLCFESWGRALEDRCGRFAHLVVAGTTTRGNAIHRITSWIRDRTQPSREVERFVARMRSEA